MTSYAKRPGQKTGSFNILNDLCYIFQDLGCTEAINLDGGGSTVMLINGKQIFAPSNGAQRSVGSCVTLE